MSRADLVLDIGTTGVKAFVFDDRERILAKSYLKLEKSFPKRGWVEQDPEELVTKSRKVLKDAVERCGIPKKRLVAFGLSTQRETTIMWNKKTGQALRPAIVWEDVRTAKLSKRLNRTHGNIVRSSTGLDLDPYFSGTKILWILRNCADANRLREKGDLAFGTVDSWLLYSLAEKHPHLTDRTNASRTLCFDIRSLKWSSKLMEIFRASEEEMPEVRPSTSLFGVLHKNIVGRRLPIHAVVGDQQASLFAVGTGKGIAKATFGTGIFLMQDIGTSYARYDDFFTTLVAGGKKQRYAVEMKIGNCASRVDKALGHKKRLERLMEAFAKEISKQLEKLPLPVTTLVVDGGAARDGIVAEKIRERAGIPVHEHHIFDGTALGVLRMLRSR